MNYRAIFLADGSSDEPLGEHLEILCARRDLAVRVTTPDLRLLPLPPGRQVADRLQAVLELGDVPDILFVHRDAEGQDPERRFAEVAQAVARVSEGLPAVAVVPVRMTEAWLLLDEQSIRDVAGRPNSTVDLRLPRISQVEAQPDPKSALERALDMASGLTGRRRDRFRQRFGQHRRTLLQRLNIDGPVRRLKAWQTDSRPGRHSNRHSTTWPPNSRRSASRLPMASHGDRARARPGVVVPHGIFLADDLVSVNFDAEQFLEIPKQGES